MGTSYNVLHLMQYIFFSFCQACRKGFQTQTAWGAASRSEVGSAKLAVWWGQKEDTGRKSIGMAVLTTYNTFFSLFVCFFFSFLGANCSDFRLQWNKGEFFFSADKASSGIPEAMWNLDQTGGRDEITGAACINGFLDLMNYKKSGIRLIFRFHLTSMGFH